MPSVFLVFHDLNLYFSFRYYYFHIDALDGTLRSLSYSHDIQEAEAVRPAVSEASGKIANIKRQAQDFLEEKLKIRGSYKEVKHPVSLCHLSF